MDFFSIRFAQKIVTPIAMALDHVGIMRVEDYAAALKKGLENETDEDMKILIGAFADALLRRNDPPFVATVIEGGKKG
jgi:hypothetical protein